MYLTAILSKASRAASRSLKARIPLKPLWSRCAISLSTKRLDLRRQPPQRVDVLADEPFRCDAAVLGDIVERGALPKEVVGIPREPLQEEVDRELSGAFLNLRQDAQQ